MAIENILHTIASSKAYTRIAASANKAFSKLGNILDNDKFEKVINPIDATHSNNSFLGMATLMVACVLMPRLATALKRNPENKEATMDEIKEIFFRDASTIVVMLFMLKSANALIANFASKKNGLPMTTKPYQKLFDDSITNTKDKIVDFVSHPIQKAKIIGKNILDIVHPTGGNKALTNEEYISRYSNYTFDDLPKLLKNADDRRGNSSKVFEDILDGAIAKYEGYLNGNSKKGIPGFVNWARATINKKGNASSTIINGKNSIEATIAELKALKNQGIEGLKDVKSEAVKKAIEDYFQDENNTLVQKSMGLNAWLRTGALGFEAGFLGFGLPTLNQKRLEKKYLKENQNNNIFTFNTQDKSSGTLISKNIKAHEVKLYHNFIK